MVIIVHLVEVDRLEQVGKREADGHKGGEERRHGEKKSLFVHIVAFPGVPAVWVG